MAFDPTVVSFNLSAVDWQSVFLLEGAHLDADRVYLEELLRSATFFAGRYGVVSLGESDLIPGTSSSQEIRVRLMRCMAITPKGYLVCWNNDGQPQGGVSGSADSELIRQSTSLYLCINAVRDSAYAERPQEMRGDCKFVRPHLHLSTTNDGDLDALVIGQFRRDPDNNYLELDTGFIPECMRLDSHWLLKRRVEDIRKQARACLDALVKQLQNGQFRLEPMATSLASAAVLVDWTVSPYTYLERMLGAMRSHSALQYLIPDGDVKDRVIESLYQALKYIEPSLNAGQLDWAEALRLTEDTFKRLSFAFTLVDAPRASTPEIWIR